MVIPDVGLLHPVDEPGPVFQFLLELFFADTMGIPDLVEQKAAPLPLELINLRHPLKYRIGDEVPLIPVEFKDLYDIGYPSHAPLAFLDVHRENDEIEVREEAPWHIHRVGFHTGEQFIHGSGMDCSKRRVTDGDCLEEREGFSAPYLTNDDKLGPLPQGRDQEIVERDVTRRF